MAPLHTALSWALGLFTTQSVFNEPTPPSCDTVQQGYICSPAISQYWGEYSPYFTVPSDISSDLPDGCQYTFASILSRHGARDPIARKSDDYHRLIRNLKSNVKSFTGPYTFLSNYKYTLGKDQLTDFGRQELVNSGIKFFERYISLTSDNTPFVRASGQERVIDSARYWVQGYKSANPSMKSSHNCEHKSLEGTSKHCKEGILVIPETRTSNNTLNNGLCKNFISPDKPYHTIAPKAQKHFAETFVKPIMDRLNNDMAGANLGWHDTINFMDLCPFNTVANAAGLISPFCALFTEEEWHAYNYYESLNKFYGFGPGNPLGPTQGVGYADELLARLTNDSTYVKNKYSYTSINHTLDNNQCTFPSNTNLFADFSHDNDITTIMAGLGLFDFMDPKMLSVDHIVEPQVNGYSAGWTVPFSGRVYFEKMTCDSVDGELVRVVANDRVMPLTGCGADELGRCALDAFVESRSYARKGGDWNKLCFT